MTQKQPDPFYWWSEELGMAEPAGFFTYQNNQRQEWLRIRHPISLPEYIEGVARGTIRVIDGIKYRKYSRQP